MYLTYTFIINVDEDSLKMLRGHVKSYVSESIKSTNSQPPDIHDFDLQIEISKIHPVLWNFIFRMTASEDEEKMLSQICTNSVHHSTCTFLGGTVNEKSGT
jgi:hypothetical protein